MNQLKNEVVPTTINLFETIDISDNGFAPDSIQLKISNFISGDIIGTTSTLVTSSYNADTGILSINSNVSSENNNEKATSWVQNYCLPNISKEFQKKVNIKESKSKRKQT